MADQILNAIIQLENRIEQQLQLEQEKADAWLVAVRNELQRDAKRARQQGVEQSERQRQQAERQIENNCKELLALEMAYCRRLEELSEQKLLEVLGRQLERILPRSVDDHQNGES